MNRRQAIRRVGATALGLACAPSATVRAATTLEPGRPSLACGLEGQRIRWLVGAAIGGGYDMFSRLLEPALEERLDAEIAVENVVGAGGAIAARQIAESRPDGRTLGLMNGSGMLIAPFSNPGFAPDLRSGFTLFGSIAPHLPAISVAEDSGIHTIEDLVEKHRSRPLVMAGSGSASTNLLACSIMEDLFGVRVEHLWGLSGTPDILDAVRRGWADATGISEETVLRQDGLRLIVRFHDGSRGVGVDARVPSLGELVARSPELFPDPARAAEDATALKALCDVGRLMCGPAGLPTDMAACLRASLEATLADTAFRASATAAGRWVGPSTVEQSFAAIEVAEAARERFGEVIRRTLSRARGGA